MYWFSKPALPGVKADFAMLGQGRPSAENDRLQSPDLGKLEKCGTGL